MLDGDQPDGGLPSTLSQQDPSLLPPPPPPGSLPRSASAGSRGRWNRAPSNISWWDDPLVAVVPQVPPVLQVQLAPRSSASSTHSAGGSTGGLSSGGVQQPVQHPEAAMQQQYALVGAALSPLPSGDVEEEGPLEAYAGGFSTDLDLDPDVQSVAEFAGRAAELPPARQADVDFSSSAQEEVGVGAPGLEGRGWWSPSEGEGNEGREPVAEVRESQVSAQEVAIVLC